MAGCSPVVQAFFVDLFHFCYFLLLFFIARKFWKLLFTIKRGEVCYFLYLFLLLVTMINYFLLGQGNYWVSLCKGGT